jgi:hypothetical protein
VLQGLQDTPQPELLREHLPDLLALAGDGLTLPTGESLDDLSLSECEAIGRAWWDMHKGFFGPLLDLAAQRAGAAGPAPERVRAPASSTAPVSSPPNADMPESGTTAGGSI